MMTRISKLTPNARESTGARTAELEVAVVLAERTDVLEAEAEAARSHQRTTPFAQP